MRSEEDDEQEDNLHLQGDGFYSEERFRVDRKKLELFLQGEFFY